MMTLLFKEELGKYIRVAQAIIKHFYAETGKEVPGWVERNTLFSIKGLEYMHKRGP